MRPSPNETLDCFDADTTFTVELYGGLQGTNDVALELRFYWLSAHERIFHGKSCGCDTAQCGDYDTAQWRGMSVDGFVDVDVTIVDDTGVGLCRKDLPIASVWERTLQRATKQRFLDGSCGERPVLS